MKFQKILILIFIAHYQVACAPMAETKKNPYAGYSSIIGEEFKLQEYSSGKDIHQIFSEKPKGEASISQLCSQNRNDRFFRALCQNTSPFPTTAGQKFSNLNELYIILSLNDATNTNCTTNSVSLVRNDNSVLNPRCIRYSARTNTLDATAVGYQRDNKTMLEIATKDSTTKEINFYLVDYELPCESTVEGCKERDYYLEQAEANWKNISVYTEQDLKNTVFDCLMCHQPGGPGTPKRFMMAEAEFPWTHWFDKDTDCGKSLFDDFAKAHAGETKYAGTPIATLKTNEAVNLEFFVNNHGFQGRTFGNNFFDSLRIEGEVNLTDGQPFSNEQESQSETWQQEYTRRNAMLGLKNFGGVGMPYRDCKQSDPKKLTHFQNVMNEIIVNKNTSVVMPQLPTVNLDSEEKLRERGLMAAANLAGKALLNRSCVACHNSNLDSTISRANFNAQELEKNNLVTLAKSIQRLQMNDNDLLLMPPKHYIQLTKEERIELIRYLTEVSKKLQQEL